MKSDGFTDHEILNEEMHVIWAVGQEPGDYSHIPKSGLEHSPDGTPSVLDFYKPDELKYHGKKNRGIVSMNFFEEVWMLQLLSKSGFSDYNLKLDLDWGS